MVIELLMTKEVGMIYTNEDRSHSTRDFLLYSYFGFTEYDLLNLSADDILLLLINRAYRDAASHVLSVQGTEEKMRCKEAGIEKIKEKINKLAKSENSDFDDWHEKLCDVELKNIYNGHKFTVGMAQKWVNMTLKYMKLMFDYICDMGVAENLFVEKYSNLYDKYLPLFHIPIDNYMYQAIKRNTGKIIVSEGRNILTGLGINPPQIAWSNLDDYNIYIEYQNEIRKGLQSKIEHGEIKDIFLIEWESPVWIAQAKKKRK